MQKSLFNRHRKFHCQTENNKDLAKETFYSFHFVYQFWPTGYVWMRNLNSQSTSDDKMIRKLLVKHRTTLKRFNKHIPLTKKTEFLSHTYTICKTNLTCEPNYYHNVKQKYHKKYYPYINLQLSKIFVTPLFKLWLGSIFFLIIIFCFFNLEYTNQSQAWASLSFTKLPPVLIL